MMLWIQLHDLNSEQLPSVNQEDAISAFRQFDWNTELERLRKAELDDGAEICQPGMGLVAEDGRQLQIYPNDATSVHFYLRWPALRKAFVWVGNHVEEVHFVEEYPIEAVPALISYYFEDQREEILNIEGESWAETVE